LKVFFEEASKIVFSKLLNEIFDFKILEENKKENIYNMVKNVFKLSVKDKVGS
jgi:hypothetical protein